MRKRVAVLDDYQGAGVSEPHWKQLEKRIVLDGYRDTLHDENALVRRLLPYEIVVLIRERTCLSASILRQLPRLELLALTGKNSGQVDLEAATSLGILVTQTKSSGASPVEMTMGLILAAAHRIPQEHMAVRQGSWQTGVGFDLASKTLGIVGLGRIGRQIASFGKFVGMRVIAWSPHLTGSKAAEAGAEYVSLDDLFLESDVVTLHLRLSERTKGIVTARQIFSMKPTACFVNTARGDLVDEESLVTALRERRIQAAALDVFHTEPLPADHALRSLDNVILTPHMGYVTAEGYEAFFGGAVENISAYLDGRTPSASVNPEVLSGPASRRRTTSESE